LIWPGPESNRNSDLGIALISGAVVALAVLYLQVRLSNAAEKRNLQLQLGLQDKFPGIDLSHHDLSGFHIPGKDLRQANLTGTNLRGANLSGANLQHAILNKADLRGAKLDETPLYPSEDLFPSDDLLLGSIYEAVNHNSATFNGAKYDSKTKCPNNLDLKKRGVIPAESRWHRLLLVNWWLFSNKATPKTTRAQAQGTVLRDWTGGTATRHT
jgi:uncharacterized protein YjbI with pentapeptide repeats